MKRFDRPHLLILLLGSFVRSFVAVESAPPFEKGVHLFLSRATQKSIVVLCVDILNMYEVFRVYGNGI